MKFSGLFCSIFCVALLSGCADFQDFAPEELTHTDLVSPPVKDNPDLQAAALARARGDVSQAIHDYREIIKNCVDCEEAYIGLGASLLDVNAVDEAKQTFQKAISLYPTSADAYAGLGNVYLIIDQPENAIAAFETALKFNSCLAKALNGYGIALDMLGDHQGAQINYRAAMELDPANISYESNLGLSMVLAGNTAEAIFILERLARSPKVTPKIRQNLSLAYGLAGDMKMARTIGAVDLSNDWVNNNIQYMEAVRKTEEYAGLITKENVYGPLNETRKWQDRTK